MRGAFFFVLSRWRRELFDTVMGKHSAQGHVGEASIGALWKKTDYATQARDHGGGERLPRLLPG